MLDKSQDTTAATWHRLCFRAFKHSVSFLLSRDPIEDFSSTQLFSATINLFPLTRRRAHILHLCVRYTENISFLSRGKHKELDYHSPTFAQHIGKYFQNSPNFSWYLFYPGTFLFFYIYILLYIRAVSVNALIAIS